VEGLAYDGGHREGAAESGPEDPHLFEGGDLGAPGEAAAAVLLVEAQAEEVMVSQDLENSSFSARLFRGIPVDLGQDDLVIPCSATSFLGDVNVLSDPVIVGDDEISLRTHFIPPDHLTVSPFQHLENSRGVLPPSFFLAEVEGHPVAVHQVLDLSLAQKDIRKVRVFGDEESKAVRVGLQPAHNYFPFWRKAVTPSAEFDDLVLIDQLLQSRTQRLAAVRIDAEGLGDFREGEAPLFVSLEQFQDFCGRKRRGRKISF
jgi:hypothetical protein